MTDGAEDIASTDGDSSTHTKSSWRLVWCYEKCHKQECKASREALAQNLRGAGGSLVCLRKAKKFAAWIGEGEHPPYLLLSDWREIKPCMQALTQPGVHGLPAVIVVFVDQPRLHRRVTQWAETIALQGLRCRLYVLPKLSELWPLIVEMTGQGLVASTIPAVGGLPPLQGALLQSAAQPAGGRDALGGPCGGGGFPPLGPKTLPWLPGALGGAARAGAAERGSGGGRAAVGGRAAAAPAAPGPRGGVAGAAPFVASKALELQPSVTQVLGQVVPWESAAEVLCLLLSALPTHYDD